jgi:hypothetical protein
MKTCLNCQKEYQHKREASKFCSDRCRVAYNRKHPKQTVSPVQMQVLYNSMLELVGKIGAPSENVHVAPKQALAAPISRPVAGMSAEAIMHKYVEDRREINDEGQYMDWIGRLNNDARLTQKQKELVKSTR